MKPRKLDKPTPRLRKASEEELALWRHATRNAQPNPDAGRGVPKPLPPRYDPRPFEDAIPPAFTATHVFPDAASIDPLTDRTPGLDRNTAKALRNGERAPEATVDLHGMTLERAHGALNRFILAERKRGARCVLVITGKGGDYLSRAKHGYDMHGGGGGALRRDVPRWLREPPLTDSVVGVYQAHKRHGGDGAIYVYLRKAR